MQGGGGGQGCSSLLWSSSYAISYLVHCITVNPLVSEFYI